MPRAPDLETLRTRLGAAIDLNSEGHPVAARQAFARIVRAVQGVEDADRELLVVLSRAHLGLATSSFDQHGDLAAALEHIDSAERWARAADAPQVLVAVQGQRGLVNLGSGNTDAALLAFDSAVSLIAHAEPFDQLCLLLNRGALHLELGSLAAARRDLSRCADLAVEAEDRLLEFKARHNLGYVEFLAGNLPRALAEMSAAADLDYGGPWPIALLDRARVLREAGLFSEADVLLREASELFLTDRLAQGAAETDLVRAECALAMSAPQDARALASAARRQFRGRRNVRWQRKAERLVLVAELALAVESGSPAGLRALGRRAGRLADTCAAEGRDDLARTARLLQADSLLAAGETPAVSRSWLRVGRQDPIGVRLQVRHVRARTAAGAGDLRTARTEVRRGLEEVSAYQARFGSLDMRTASAVHGERLGRLDLELALGSGRPADVFASIERTRAASWRLPAVRPPDDDETASLLSRLRQVEEEARGLEGSTKASELARLRGRAAGLRDAVRTAAWEREGTRDAGVVRSTATLESVREELAREGSALVSLVAHAGAWHAALVTDGRVEHHVLGDVLATAELVHRVRADLDALSRPGLPEVMRAAVRRSLETSLAGLDALMLRPLDVDGRRLVVSPTGPMATVPWGLLPSRRGVAVAVAPSATTWVEASSRGRAGARHPGPFAVASVAGPGLARAESEARAVAATWSSRAVTGTEASTSAVTAALAGRDVVHIAAHGRHDLENPLFSSLRLADGPLFAHELDTTARMASCVALSACEVGLSTPRPGNEALGLSSVLLQLGASSVVAGVARVADDVAAEVMERLHRSMADGVDSATALAIAQQDVGLDGTIAPFVCFGAGWTADRATGPGSVSGGRHEPTPLGRRLRAAPA